MSPQHELLMSRDNPERMRQGTAESDASLLAALAFTPDGAKSHSSDEWSDPRDPQVLLFSPPLLNVISSSRWTNSPFSPLSVTETEQQQQKEQQPMGIEIPALLQPLLGLAFLPFTNNNNNSNHHQLTTRTANHFHHRPEEEDDLTDEGDLVSIRSDLSLEVALEEGQDDNDDRGDDQELLHGNKPKQQQLSAIGKLKHKVKEAGQRRKQKRRDRLGSRDSLGSVTPRNRTDSSPRERLDSRTSSNGMDDSSRKGERRNASCPVADIDATWIQKQQAKLSKHKFQLESVQSDMKAVQLRTQALSSHLSKEQQRVEVLEEALAKSLISLQKDAALLQQAKKELKRLEEKCNMASHAVEETEVAIRKGLQKLNPPSECRVLPAPPIPQSISSPPRRCQSYADGDHGLNPMLATPRASNLIDHHSSHSAPPRGRASSTPNLPLRASASFIRVHDLDLTAVDKSSRMTPNDVARDFFFLDHNIKTVLEALVKSGYDMVIDESDRFTPALNTERLLPKCRPDPSWPVYPWHAAFDKEILVWTGSVSHNGHGCDLPVIKARGIIPTSPRKVVELLMDSSRVHEYNKMSQGRTDIVYLQRGLDTTAEASDYGLAGEAKIVQSLSKPPLIRRAIEMVSLLYVRPLSDGYLTVSRSVWEDSTGSPKSFSKDAIRSEILLGVNLFRAVSGPNGKEYCELTTITHAHTSAVPEYLTRKMGPTQAATVIRDIQALF